MPRFGPKVEDWCAYQERVTAPKPSHQRPMPAKYRGVKAPATPEPEPPAAAGIVVEESTASDTFIGRVRRLWAATP